MQSKIGEIYEGKVTGLTSFGAFVKLANGETGMVHISEVATVYVKDIKDHLTEGQDVKVKVIGINENNKISLSIKQTVEAPVEKTFEKKSGGGSQQSHYDDRKRSSGQRNSSSGSSGMSFEDMMAKFKQESDEKMSALKRSSDFKSSKRGNRP